MGYKPNSLCNALTCFFLSGALTSAVLLSSYYGSQPPKKDTPVLQSKSLENKTDSHIWNSDLLAGNLKSNLDLTLSQARSGYGRDIIEDQLNQLEGVSIEDKFYIMDAYTNGIRTNALNLAAQTLSTVSQHLKQGDLTLVDEYIEFSKRRISEFESIQK